MTIKKFRKLLAGISVAALLSTLVVVPTAQAANYWDDAFTGLSITGEPGTQINRCEAAVIVLRAMGEDQAVPSPYPFDDVDDWAKGYVGALYNLGVVQGEKPGKFGCGNALNRGAAAVMFANAFGLTEMATLTAAQEAEFTGIAWAKDAFAKNVKAGLIQGKPGGVLDPGGANLRAEAATIAWRGVQAGLGDGPSEEPSGDDAGDDAGDDEAAVEPGEPVAIQKVRQSFVLSTAGALSVGSKAHTVTVSSATEAEATLTVESTPVELTVEVGACENINTDAEENDYDDLEVCYEGLDADGNPEFSFTPIAEPAPLVPVSAGDLTVTVSADNPAAELSVVADTTSADGAQAQIALFALDFAAAGEAVTVTDVQFLRTGVASDTDVANAYLYQGDKRLAEMQSISEKVLTFRNSSGIFSVDAKSKKTIWLKFDLGNGSTAGKTVSFDLRSVTANTDSVALPAKASSQTARVAGVADLGKLTIANSSPTAAGTVDPEEPQFEAWKFTLAGSDQDVEVHKINFTLVGSVANSDLGGFSLWDGATQWGSTVTSVGDDKVLTFDMSGNFPMDDDPKTPPPAGFISAGVTKTMSLRTDIIAGTNRTFRFSVQKQSDLIVKDQEYDVWLKPNQTDTFSVIEPTDGTNGVNWTINSGSLTVKVNEDSPSGNIPLDYTDQVLARYDFTASGEDVKITSLNVSADTSVASAGINNGKLYIGGKQIGSTADLVEFTGSGTFSFGNNFTVKAGETTVLEVRGEVKKAAATSFSDGDTVAIKLLAGSSNAQGKQSLASISTSASTGYTMTVRAGTLAVAENLSLGDGTSSAPTAVKGANNVRIGSFSITAGTGEGSTISQIVLRDDVDSTFIDGEATANDLEISTAWTANATVYLTFTNAAVVDKFNAINVGETYFVREVNQTTDGCAFTVTAKAAATRALTGTSSSCVGTVANLADNDDVELYTEDTTVSTAATDTLKDIFQNLQLWHNRGAEGAVQLGSTKGSLTDTASTQYTFNVTGLTLAAGEVYVVDVYADILTDANTLSANLDTSGLIDFFSVTASGVDTGTATSDTSTDNLQNIFIASSGGLTLTVDATTPVAGQLVMASTGKVVASYKFEASDEEDVEITRIVVNNNTTSNYRGSTKNTRVIERSGTAAGVGTQIGSTVASLDSSGNATFDLVTPYVLAAGDEKLLDIVVDVSAYPTAVSGTAHTFTFTVGSFTVRGKDSGQTITGTSSGTTNAQDVYRTKLTAALPLAPATLTPTGSATAGANSEVLRFELSAASNRDAVLNAIGFTVSGSVDTTGSGNALLYKSTDLATAISTETYKAITFVDATAAGTDAGNEVDFEISNNADAADGIPMGANVRVLDGGAGGTYLATDVVNSIALATAVVTVGLTDNATDLDDGDILYYRPLQPGTSGKLYFGAQALLTADLASSGTTLTLASTNGFSTGDTVYVQGFDANGVAVTRSSGCVISDVDSATQLTTSACVLSNTATIDYNYLATAANAVAKNQTSDAVAYTGLDGSGGGETIAKGTTKTLVLKGDSTGGTSNETLRIDITAASNLNWDDGLHFGITSDTLTFPITGGTLTY